MEATDSPVRRIHKGSPALPTLCVRVCVHECVCACVGEAETCFFVALLGTVV